MATKTDSGPTRRQTGCDGIVMSAARIEQVDEQGSTVVRVESAAVLSASDLAVFMLLTSLMWLALSHVSVQWLTLEAWRTSPVLMAVITVLAALTLLNQQGRWLLLPHMRRPKPLPAPPGYHVAVVTTFVPGVESLEMLGRMLRALVKIRYPHETWLLDEGNTDAVKTLCRQLGVYHFSRHSRPEYRTERGHFQAGTKHGNYNAWLQEIGFARYDVISAFDPDHVPHATFLDEVLGYFTDPEVGYVQAAQAYENQDASFIARGAAEETYGYYSSIQMAAYGLGYPIVVGCHNTHRTAALKAVGGFAPHDADDLLITMLYRIGGWRGVYVPKILARGLTPCDWNGYVGQQRRWTRSILDLKLRHFPRLGRSLPSGSRFISRVHGLNYLIRTLAVPVWLSLLAVVLVRGRPEAGMIEQMIPSMIGITLAIAACEVYRQRFYLDPDSEGGLHWRAALLQLAKWPTAAAAIVDVLMDRRVPYIITPKLVTGRRRQDHMWPHALTALVIALAWGFGPTVRGIGGLVMHIVAGVAIASLLGVVASTGWLSLAQAMPQQSDMESP